jgi:hypothetical protein
MFAGVSIALSRASRRHRWYSSLRPRLLLGSRRLRGTRHRFHNGLGHAGAGDRTCRCHGPGRGRPGLHVALVTGGGVQCWGGTVPLDDGTIGTSLVPVAVPGLSGVTAIGAGIHHTCAVVAGGAVTCWGGNENGELGNGSASFDPCPPVTVVGLAGATAVAPGGFHTCARVPGGNVKCWGSMTRGSAGTEPRTPTSPSRTFQVSPARES